MAKIFVICPVRKATAEEMQFIENYVAQLEDGGNIVHWPARDTDQDDEIGLRICQDNRSAISDADEIHVYWNKDSAGSLFDFGMAFALHKLIILFSELKSTSHKSFDNVLLALSRRMQN